MKRILGLCSLALVLVLSACGGGGSTAGKGTLIVGPPSELEGIFNPLYLKSSYDRWAVDLMFQKLIEYNSENELEPLLATEMPEISEDKKSYTFKIHPDAQFSDGQPVTADDVIFTYTVISDKTYTGRDSSAKNLLGAKEYASGKATEVEGLKKIDDKTVTITFVEALRTNIYECMAGILPKHVYGEKYKQGLASVIEEKNSEPIGSGPYVLVNHSPDAGTQFSKNENYWGEGYNIQNIIIKPVTQATDLTALEKGEINLIAGMIEPLKLEAVDANENLTRHEYTRAGFGYLTFNTTNGATKDVKVRQALYHGFDNDGFIESYFKMKSGDLVAKRPTSTYSPVSWVQGEKLEEALPKYEYDLEKAAKILDEAGWKMGSDGKRSKDGEKLTVKVLAIKDHSILDTLISMWQKDWKEKLGVDLQIATVDFNTVMNTVGKQANLKEWNLFFIATTFVNDDPDGSVYDMFDTASIGDDLNNYSRFSDPKLDEMIAKARVELDHEKALSEYIEIGKYTMEQAVVIPVYANVYSDAYSKKLKGLKTSAYYSWPLAIKNATIEE